MKLFYFVNARIPTEKAYGWAVAKICESFADLGARVRLVLPDGRNKIKLDIFEYYQIKKNFEVERVKNINLIGRFRFIHKLIFLLQNFSFLFFSSRLSVEKQDIIYLRNIEHLLFWPRKNKNVFFELHFLSRKDKFFLRLVKRAKGVIVVTQALKDYLVFYGLAPDKILVAPDAVDLAAFDITQTKESCRAKLNLPENKKIILYTGHLYEWKGADTLAKAAPYLPSEMLVVFVGGTERDVRIFKSQFSNFENVMIVGHRPHQEMPLWLKAADVLVLPNSGKREISRYWTSPLKMFEYMASRRPIVASDLPSLREILSPESAVLVDPDNAPALAEGISRVLKDAVLSDRISAEAWGIVQQYTWARRAERIIEFINRHG